MFQSWCSKYKYKPVLAVQKMNLYFQNMYEINSHVYKIIPMQTQIMKYFIICSKYEESSTIFCQCFVYIGFIFGRTLVHLIMTT